MKVYKSSVYKLCSYFVWAIFVSSFILILLFMLLGDKKLDEVVTIILGIAFVLGVMNALLHYIKVTVDDEAIVFSLFNRAYHKISMHEPVISSYIVNHYVNGLPTGKTFYIRVIHGDNKRKDYRCSGFSKKTFQKLISDIYLLRNEKATQDEEVEDVIETEGLKKTYHIPKDDLMLKEYKRQTKLWIIFLSLSSVICIGLYLVLLNAGVNAFSSEMIGPFLAMIAMILMMCLGIPFFSFRKQLKAISKEIPSRLVLDDTFLTIDEETFEIAQMKSVKVTPPKYNNAMSNQKRSMSFQYQGKNYVYYFGYINPQLPYYMKYGNLCNHLEVVFKKQKQFIYEL
ncbi:hypothetical protein LJC02_03640 [Breznakia sp. OttesenSCG-928-G09]|nr:hypothetical protein [Breznakia sp. OttesenSCG-928-G09]